MVPDAWMPYLPLIAVAVVASAVVFYLWRELQRAKKALGDAKQRVKKAPVAGGEAEFYDPADYEDSYEWEEDEYADEDADADLMNADADFKNADADAPNADADSPHADAVLKNADAVLKNADAVRVPPGEGSRVQRRRGASKAEAATAGGPPAFESAK